MSQLKKIALAEMLSDLRAELLKARSDASESELRFEIADVELEVQLSVTKGAEGGGGVKFWVYNAEAQVSANEAKTHKLKLRLKPLNAADRSPFDVSDQESLEG